VVGEWASTNVVQAHLPILEPVRTINSSGMFFDKGENSQFFKAMQQFNVDVYFAGEVSHVQDIALRNILLTSLTCF